MQEIPIEVVPRQAQNDWINIHAAGLKIPHQFGRRPAIRFILVYSPEVSELIILCHHIICDGMSLAYLARDSMEYLGNPAAELQVLPAPEPIVLGAQPHQAHTVSAVNLRDRLPQYPGEGIGYYALGLQRLPTVLAFICADFEGRIEWAESDEGGEKEYCAENDKDNAENTGYDTAKIQIGEQCSDDDTDDAIDIGHIAIHD